MSVTASTEAANKVKRSIRKLPLDPYTKTLAMQFLHGMDLEPMSKVLALVPGSSITMKAPMM